MVGASRVANGPGQDRLAQHLDVPGEGGQHGRGRPGRAGSPPGRSGRRPSALAGPPRSQNPCETSARRRAKMAASASSRASPDRAARRAGRTRRGGAPADGRPRTRSSAAASGAGASRARLQPVEQAVLGLAQGHLDLVGGHGRHVARLLAEQQLGRGLPVAQRDVAEDGHDGGRHHDGEQGEERTARAGELTQSLTRPPRGAAGSRPPSPRRRPRRCDGSGRSRCGRRGPRSATRARRSASRWRSRCPGRPGSGCPAAAWRSTTLSCERSQKNSGLCTPTIVSPRASYRSCQARNCGITFWQLIHPYVQNSTSTTRPRSACDA